MISFIVAMDENRVIGKDNRLPWHLPEDLKHFKRVTNGHPIIMGRKTFAAIGRPLPNRRNIILTKNKQFNPEGCEVIHSLEEIKTFSEQEEEVFVIGGEKVFEQTFPYAEKMYITIIHDTFQGDTFFPDYDIEKWQTIEKKAGTVDEKNKYPHTFLTLKRK